MSTMRYYNARVRRMILSGEPLPKWLVKNPRFDYIVAVNLSTPDWADRDAIWALRMEARRLTEETGVRHVLDHEIPVTHPRVCGLTVPCNMRVVPWRVNASKSNKWNPDQLELFT